MEEIKNKTSTNKQKKEKVFDPTTYLYYKDLKAFIDEVITWSLTSGLVGVSISEKQILTSSGKVGGSSSKVAKVRGFVSSLARERFSIPYVTYENKVSLKAIASFFGVDHSSIINNLKVHQRRMGTRGTSSTIKRDQEYIDYHLEAQKLFILDKNLKTDFPILVLENEKVRVLGYSVRQIILIIRAVYADFGVTLSSQEAGEKFKTLQKKNKGSLGNQKTRPAQGFYFKKSLQKNRHDVRGRL